MQQTDMFEETLEKKIVRMERWINRLQKEMFFLKEVYNLTQRARKLEIPKEEIQSDLFGT
jgi:hypothetical protein